MESSGKKLQKIKIDHRPDIKFINSTKSRDQLLMMEANKKYEAEREEKNKKVNDKK
jgi:hypothetical protein